MLIYGAADLLYIADIYFLSESRHVIPVECTGDPGLAGDYVLQDGKSCSFELTGFGILHLRADLVDDLYVIGILVLVDHDECACIGLS